jgi:hypothetical protein
VNWVSLMNRSGVLKIAASIVVIMMGLSTLVVGMELSSEGTTATAHRQVSTNPSQNPDPVNTTCRTQTSADGSADIISNHTALNDGSSPQRLMSGNCDLRSSAV